jgi:inorganic triphosphatase YgiF
MPQETELKLSLLPADRPRLLAHPLLRATASDRLHLRNTYFDTPALALMAQRIAVRERRIGRQTLLTVKTAGTSVGGLSRRGEWEGPTRPGAFDFAALVDDTALAQALGALAGQLVPVFRTDFVRRRWVIQHAGASMEVALDEGTVSTDADAPQGRQQQALLELELELLSGPVDALLDLAHTLALGPAGDASSGLWLYPSTRSKAERGLDLFLGRQPAPARAEPLRLAPKASPVQAFAAAALNSLDQLQANLLPWLMTGDGGLEASPETDAGQGMARDPEWVHQARVALRRLRTSLRVFAPFLPPRFNRHWNARWKASAALLGAPRDWDVLATTGLPRWLGEALAQPEWQPMQAWVNEQRQAAHRAARAVLHRPEHALDLLAFTRALMVLPVEPAKGHSPKLDRWARQALHQQHKRLMRQTKASLREGPEGRHALRLRVKRFHYALDALGSLLAPDVLARQSASLTRAQTVLGDLNDLSTAQTLLADCPLPERDDVMARIDTELARRLRRLPRLERALLSSAPPG